MNKLASSVLAVLIASSVPPVSAQQVFPPGMFAIDGVPVVCGSYPTVLAPALQDVGFFNGQALILNPAVMQSMPTPVKLYVYAHECAHGMGLMDEAAADCWAIRAGRDQGWFHPQFFGYLRAFFQNNPGSWRHPPGPARVQNMVDCYQQ